MEPVKDKQLLLSNIVQNLMLRTSSISDLGLLSGKMGICIFFYRYARHTGIKRYADFAGELLDEIYGEINTGISRDFEKGLAGICWGIEYLVRKGFVDADANDVLGDMDTIIMERDVRRITEISLETGLEGIAHYVLARCSNRQTLPIDRQYVAELVGNVANKGCCPELTTKLGKLLAESNVDYSFDLIDTIAAHSALKKKSTFKDANLGISKSGLAGSALRMINEQVI